MATRKLKQGLIITGAIVVFIIAPLIAWLVITVTTIRTGIEFIVVPDAITVTINDEVFVVNYEQKVAVDPGTYTLSFRADGFESEQQDITVTNGSITQVYLAMTPLNEAARNRVSGSIMQSRIERIGGYNSGRGTAEIEKEYPFVDKLPITDKYFTITPCFLEDSTVGICIKLAINADFYRQRALQAINDKGIDATTVTIKYL